MPFTVKVRIEGAREILQAFDRMSKGANDELRQGSTELAGRLMRAQQAAGSAVGRQARAVSSRGLRVERDRVPVVSAGRRGGAKIRNLIAGSEFGMDRHTGWYNRRRYNDLPKHQFYRWSGNGPDAGYWFFPTARAMQPEIERGWLEIADRIVKKWGKG